ncbi:hypothetical protein GCM10022386_13160 [Flavobacterium cheonhonense]|uniref:Rhamnosyltransferase n=1 Tax=Flavobacterium cheonhonense TaxID=706185 RepID=A0ABP7TSG2_9FLAO|nr:glycosyltransferase [Flavobacterium cheonhonense]
MIFEHYLITRFNLKNPKWKFTKNNELLLNDQWMDERMALFADFCLPSVVAQTNKNFKWLLYFDTDTSEKHRAQITELLQPHPFIEAHYIDGMPMLVESIRQYITTHVKAEYLITSRIDNDDSISKHFIETIQSKFDKQEHLAVDVTAGYTLNLSPVMIGKKEHLFNPFMSLIEKTANAKTVWFYDHNMWKKEKNIIHLSHPRLWMSNIHEKNKVNEFDGYGNINWDKVSQDFILSPEKNAEIAATVIPQSKWRWLSCKNQLYVTFGFYLKLIKKKLGLYKIK